MKGLKRLVLCSVLASAPVWSLAQGNPGQGPGMMDQETMQQMRENMSQMQGMMESMPQADSRAERQRLMEQHMESMQEHMGMMRGSMMGQGMMGNGQGMMRDGQGMMGNGQGMMKDGQGMMGNGQGMMGDDQGMMGNRQGENRAGAGDQAGPDTDMDDDQRLRMMENRLDQMQLMMEQMLEHQARSQE